MSLHHLSLSDLKTQAKSLRAALTAAGQPVSHSQSLELMAKQHGFRDWNTLHARVGNAVRPGFALNQRVEGTYLGQPFRGEIIGIRAMASNTRFSLTLRFDDPVDVITFEGMTNFRSQVQMVVGSNGVSAEKTSDGAPHLRIWPEKN
ncbi:MAG: glyoxalase superfamily protein [Pseudomonadota bacterium]